VHINKYEPGALSPSHSGFYARPGWELWQGALIRTADGLEPAPENEEVMILRLPQTPALDLHASLSAEWRNGELW
jgi:aminoglycoside 2'-N-acetyltransferase I